MDEYAYLPRLIEPLVKKAAKTSPVLVVTGARQTGKSTLVRHLAPDAGYLTLDDVEVMDRVRPRSAWWDGSHLAGRWHPGRTVVASLVDNAPQKGPRSGKRSS